MRHWQKGAPASIAAFTPSPHEALHTHLRSAPSVVFVVECPSPQRNPVFDQIATWTSDFLVIYAVETSEAHGWGRPELRHPHCFVDAAPRQSALTLALFVLRQRSRLVLASFGVRRSVRQWALLTARLVGTPIVTRSDANVATVRRDQPWRRLVRKCLWRILLPTRTRVWTIGEANEAYWTQYMGLENTLRIPYSVPVLPSSSGIEAAARASDPQRIRVLFVGRLSPEKRVDLLIEAFRGLQTLNHEKWSLTIVGDGPLEAALQQQAAGDSRIRFTGSVEHHLLDTFYLDADVLVLPSDYDAWGVVVNEALGFGLWVIVSESVGALEAVRDAAGGSSFRAGDARELSKRLIDVAHHLERKPRPTYDASSAMWTDLTALLARSKVQSS